MEPRFRAENSGYVRELRRKLIAGVWQVNAEPGSRMNGTKKPRSESGASISGRPDAVTSGRPVASTSAATDTTYRRDRTGSCGTRAVAFRLGVRPRDAGCRRCRFFLRREGRRREGHGRGRDRGNEHEFRDRLQHGSSPLGGRTRSEKNCITAFRRQDDRGSGSSGNRVPPDFRRLKSGRQPQHFGGQNGLPSKQNPSVGVIFPEVAQTWTLHHFAVLHGPVQRAPAVQAGLAAAFFLPRRPAALLPVRRSPPRVRVSRSIWSWITSRRIVDPVP